MGGRAVCFFLCVPPLFLSAFQINLNIFCEAAPEIVYLVMLRKSERVCGVPSRRCGLGVVHSYVGSLAPDVVMGE